MRVYRPAVLIGLGSSFFSVYFKGAFWGIARSHKRLDRKAAEAESYRALLRLNLFVTGPGDWCVRES